jgi:hypothetical protein
MSSSQGRQNGKKTIYSSKTEVKDTTGVYSLGRDKRNELRFNRRKKQNKQLKIAALSAVGFIVAMSMLIAFGKNAVNVYLGDECVGMIKKPMLQQRILKIQLMHS